jgi:NAD(P)-dependent dehydrogenase (short-subunit alcohol dehydrogenase family)
LTDHPARSGAALVTGGGKRIGRAIALELARAGFDVVIHYRSSEDAARAVADEVRALGRKAATVKADLAVEAQVRTLIADAAQAIDGQLAVLVNNASVFEDDRVGSLGRESWDAHIETNLRAPIVLAEVFAGQAPDGSAIINLLDQRVLKPDPRFISYALSRNGLWWATRTLAQALAPRIRVNAIGPGPTLPNERQNDEDFRTQVDAVILKTGPQLGEFGRTIRFLFDTPSMTGQMIALDGGQHLAWQTPDILEIVE